MILVDHEYHGAELAGPIPQELWNWLVDNFGEPTGERWFFRNNIIYFSNKLDHMIFLIRGG